MIQPKTDLSAARSRIEPIKGETVQQNARLRDPRLARQMQYQNSAQRNFPQRNRTAPLGPGIQRFGPASASFASNNQLDNQVVNRAPAAFNATNMNDSGRQPPRTPSKNRSSTKDVKTRLISKSSPKSQKSSSQKSPKSPSTASPSSKSSSKSSKTSPTSNRLSSKDHKKDRFKEKESSKLSPSQALAEAEKKIKEFTIPFKKRSPSPNDKSTKSITDPKVSSTTKTADSPIKFKGSKTNSKSRNYARRNRDESPIPNKDIVEQKTPPLTASTTTSATTTAAAGELSGSPIPPLIEPVANVPAIVAGVPFAGVGENQSFKSKDTQFVVRLVKVSHIVHSLLTRLMMSIGLIIDCINHRDDILNKLIVIGTGDNFFIKNFLSIFFVASI